MLLLLLLLLCSVFDLARATHLLSVNGKVRLIFYYLSGHGGCKGGEKDGMDKYLCLVDYQETG